MLLLSGLLWPGLFLYFGTRTPRANQLAAPRRGLGLILLGFPFATACYLNGESGFFYLLFALTGCALLFVQLRVWQPRWTEFLALLLPLTAFIVGGGFSLEITP